MKRFVLLTFILVNCFSYGQQVTVRGMAIDSTNGRNKVFVRLNDTLEKYLKSKDFDIKKYKIINENKSNYAIANKKNRFKIKAKLSDSLTFSSYRHISKTFLVSDLLLKEKIKIVLEPQICEEYISCDEENPKLYVFIGKKIKVDYATNKYYCNRISMNSKYNAEFKIIENLYGSFKKDTINFVAYRHYGKPGFSDYENVILYVADYCGELIHVNDQYNDVYETEDGKWASPYQGFDYKNFDTVNFKKPILMDFKREITFELEKGTDPGWFEKRFPSPYYETKGFKAKAIYGNYVMDIFEIMKETVLKSRGFFK